MNNLYVKLFFIQQCLEKISELKMKLKLLCQKENQLQEDNKEMSDRLTNIESKMTQVRKEKTDAECKQQKVCNRFTLSVRHFELTNLKNGLLILS